MKILGAQFCVIGFTVNILSIVAYMHLKVCSYYFYVWDLKVFLLHFSNIILLLITWEFYIVYHDHTHFPVL